ncbi:hypothetical protein CEUSTIGMA_g8873.t1 [Chlamydomonas eustigma]|uniref:Uncharacterized protein n=1 Tax=Chlamydomonas eustigma TaxID=1157962 RepID=A0A250XEF3_9CHLO|nr:hypothetical protein CEUSTIGMA_g8873.t1 [Chlamydomonas eustigma]|eukprot:GAX81443.1 hypothetical protein CEUSTIGMA_g8873.t1 [Chlamydomonas eustigma]
MPTSSSHATRKRRGDDNSESRSDRPVKRSVAFISHLLQRDLTLKDSFRQSITRIYQISRLLGKFSEEDEDLSENKEAADAFRTLLDSGKGGSCPIRRLAARLVPRFLPLFPHQLEPSINMLINLHQARHRSSDHDVDSVLSATKSDALQGLGSCLDLATKAPKQSLQGVQHLVHFLIRYVV